MSSESEDRSELAEERTDFAEERTEWADQRTFLAQERTYAGWVRTGLTSIAVGLGIIELLREVQPQWLITALGLVFIAVGGAINALAFVSYRKVSLNLRDTSRPDMALPITWIGGITISLILCAIGGLVLVFG